MSGGHPSGEPFVILGAAGCLGGLRERVCVGFLLSMMERGGLESERRKQNEGGKAAFGD